MAILNNMYIFVETEDVTRGVEISQHPVEEGLDLTDNVKRQPITLSLSGEIVGENAAQILSDIADLHQKGKFVSYAGRNIISNALITSFNSGHPNTIFGGCSFDMEITEIRIANSSYDETIESSIIKGGTQQVQDNSKGEEPRYYTVKKGDCLWNIAKSYYGSGSLYTKIYEANKDKISNPNLIHAAQVLLIPY